LRQAVASAARLEAKLPLGAVMELLQHDEPRIRARRLTSPGARSRLCIRSTVHAPTRSSPLCSKVGLAKFAPDRRFVLRRISAPPLLAAKPGSEIPVFL